MLSPISRRVVPQPHSWLMLATVSGRRSPAWRRRQQLGHRATATRPHSPKPRRAPTVAQWSSMSDLPSPHPAPESSQHRPHQAPLCPLCCDSSDSPARDSLWSDTRDTSTPRGVRSSNGLLAASNAASPGASRVAQRRVHQSVGQSSGITDSRPVT